MAIHPTRSRRQLTAAPVALALAAAAIGVSCRDMPTPTSPGQSLEPVLRLELAGPSVIAPGDTAQFRLLLLRADGSTRDATHEVSSWTSTSLDVLAPSGGGVVLGGTPGEATLVAHYQATTARKPVLVLPAGTFRLLGRVLEGDVSVANALVEVTAGRGAGLSAETDIHGGYRLYGVAGAIGLRVTKSGYRDAVTTIVVSEQSLPHVTSLEPAAPRANVSGRYTLTIRAARECGAGSSDQALPGEAGERTYVAEVTQTGPALAVRVTGKTVQYGFFPGRVEPTGILFDLAWYDDSGAPDPSIIEMIDDATSLSITGRVVAVVSPHRIAGALAGTLRTSRASCTSTQHELELTR